jgi:hypothetical protein
MRRSGSYKDGCPVPPEGLASLRFVYHRFDGGTAVGTLIVNRHLAADLREIFADLFAAGFPLRLAEPVDAFDANDDRAMAADDTSAFNCRAMTPSTLASGASPRPSFSLHSWGVAIDINPVENPYFKPATPAALAAWEAEQAAHPEASLPSLLAAFCAADRSRCKVLPEAGRAHLDRAPGPGVLTPDSPAVRAFRSRGFRWGGDWPRDARDKVRTDTQHFEKPLDAEP